LAPIFLSRRRSAPLCCSGRRKFYNRSGLRGQRQLPQTSELGKTNAGGATTAQGVKRRDISRSRPHCLSQVFDQLDMCGKDEI